MVADIVDSVLSEECVCDRPIVAGGSICDKHLRLLGSLLPKKPEEGGEEGKECPVCTDGRHYICGYDGCTCHEKTDHAIIKYLAARHKNL